MDVGVVGNLLVGPTGGLVFAVVALWALLKGQLVAPYYVVTKLEERNEALEKEAVTSSSAALLLREQNTELRERLAAVETELRLLREELEEMRDGKT